MKSPTDGRHAPRRTLRLDVQAFYAADLTGALINDLSETGLLIETPTVMEVGERLQVELREIGTTAAHVVWTRRLFLDATSLHAFRERP